jgi:cyclophilin family peptidyl-prolyl cis-trans isomerase
MNKALQIFLSIILLGIIVGLGYSVLKNHKDYDEVANKPVMLDSIQDTSEDVVINNNEKMSMTEEFNGVILKTNQGDIKIELYADKTPKTAGNFANLAKKGFYDGVRFHRVIQGFMIQSGDPLSKDESQKAFWGTGGPGYSFEDEFVQGLSNVPGTISMANSGPNTNGSQFFINTADNTFLDGKHSVFGKVVEGMDIVTAIENTPTEPGDKPVEDMIINSVELY